MGGWPELKQLPASTDKDNDGMPDTWENMHKLNPNDATDGAAFCLDKSKPSVKYTPNKSRNNQTAGFLFQRYPVIWEKLIKFLNAMIWDTQQDISQPLLWVYIV